MIKENIKDENKFSFQDTTKEDLQLQIKNLDTKKAMVENDIPTKTNDIVSNHLSNFFNQSKKRQHYPHYAKDSRRHSITQKRRATYPLASFLWSLNFMKETCTIKLMNTSKITFLPTYLGSEKVIVPNNV